MGMVTSFAMLVTIYSVHADMLGEFLVDANYVAIYGMAAISTALCIKAYGFLRVYCMVSKSTTSGSLHQALLDRVIAPCFPIYIIGIPLMGESILVPSYLLAMIACVVLSFLNRSWLDDLFWEKRSSELMVLSEVGNSNSEKFRSIEFQALAILYGLPVLLLLMKNMYTL